MVDSEVIHVTLSGLGLGTSVCCSINETINPSVGPSDHVKRWRLEEAHSHAAARAPAQIGPEAGPSARILISCSSSSRRNLPRPLDYQSNM